jgi:hypothetical protein
MSAVSSLLWLLLGLALVILRLLCESRHWQR